MSGRKSDITNEKVIELNLIILILAEVVKSVVNIRKKDIYDYLFY